MSSPRIKLKTGDKVKVVTGKYRGTIDFISRLDPKNQVVYLKKVSRKKYDKSTPESKKNKEKKEIMTPVHISNDGQKKRIARQFKDRKGHNFKILAKNKLYILAVSGGPDSLFLLEKMRLAGYNLVVAHVNYHKRENSDYDEKIVKNYCQKYSLPCEIYQVQDSEYNSISNFQDRARQIRYNFFQELAAKYQTKYIVVAHHRDDYRETYLLQKQKKSLVEYWDYATDATNQLPIYQRNIIRQQLAHLNPEQKAQLDREIEKKNCELKVIKKVVQTAAKRLIICPPGMPGISHSTLKLVKKNEYEPEIYLLRFSKPDQQTFELHKKEDGTLEIAGLTQAEAEYAAHPWGKKGHYRLYGEAKNFFKRLVGKPTIYNALCELEPHEVRDKDIDFVGFTNSKKFKIATVESHSKFNLFKEETSWFTFENISKWVITFASLLVAFFIFDTFFGTNILGTIAYPFRNWGRRAGEVDVPKIGYKDVGGYDEVKEELNEIAEYTLVVRATAGECQKPFLFRSGSEFEESVVGLGARRMRELFRRARELAKVYGFCFVFIDEIDSIGRKRYSAHPGHAEQTLNQLLTELDGFHPRDNVIVLAATNSLHVLDNALLRPGRFDRKIYVPSPNLKSRREIIKLCVRKLPLKSDVDLEEIAALTKGLSGAQITSMFNEAYILSVRGGQKYIDYEMIFEAYDRVLMGPSWTSQTLTLAKRKIVAYHEAGHAVIGLSLPETTVKKITIIPRLSAGGYTWIDLYGEKGDDHLINKSQMLAQVMSFLGGRASEELIFGLEYITIGAYSDFKQATSIIRDLILRYGMSDLGIVPTQETFFSSEEIPPELPEVAKQKIEREREKIMNQFIAIVAAIIHTYGYSLIFRAQATPGGLEIFTSHFSSQKGKKKVSISALMKIFGLVIIFLVTLVNFAVIEDDSQMRKSLLQKEIEEQKEKFEENGLKITEEDIKKAKKLEKEENPDLKKIFALREKNHPLTSLLKNKTGFQELENYPQEIRYYLACPDEKKEKLQAERDKIERKINSVSGETLVRKLRRKNDLENRIKELDKEKERSVVHNQIFPRDQIILLRLHSLTEENRNKDYYLLTPYLKQVGKPYSSEANTSENDGSDEKNTNVRVQDLDFQAEDGNVKIVRIYFIMHDQSQKSKLDILEEQQTYELSFDDGVVKVNKDEEGLSVKKGGGGFASASLAATSGPENTPNQETQTPKKENFVIVNEGNKEIRVLVFPEFKLNLAKQKEQTGEDNQGQNQSGNQNKKKSGDTDKQALIDKYIKEIKAKLQVAGISDEQAIKIEGLGNN
ncbi:15933_t:CDS:10 [Cetraspora pellucida]|uniref:15933_t:CDS:1 n=1 Tax=Cetraspora pellucida TaxID=1433469 RepID=A0ACA9K6C3_9GLOM|nr:15933_t:CDS:10 [Cetraspora pellucida]